jgi:xylan 1,4-beta-xylosidase
MFRWQRSLSSWLTLLLVVPPVHPEPVPTQLISIDAAAQRGRIKRVNDVDNGPLCQRGIVDLSRYYKELGIRNVRLHDVPWTYDNVLDINYVFPNWNADPDRPENYDFTQSDYYLHTISALGINIIFRLGYSAEYKTAVHHNAPPSSYDKWADIAAHIVRHYNNGWANGQAANIKYWEIWNEPDGHGLVFWAGPPEGLYRLYEVTARKLKGLDPSLKVGGPAIAGSLPFLEGFLKYEQEHKVPVDFVSWHIYTQDPHEVARRANEVHQLMARYDFLSAESILDEWNYGPVDWTKLFKDPAASRTYFEGSQDSFGAAFDATVMTDLQDAPVDIATFFSGTTFMWGLFTSSGAPQKAYYSFLAFQRLLETPLRIAVEPLNQAKLSALAGMSEDKQMVRLLVTSLGTNHKSVRLELKNLPWSGPSDYEQRIINPDHDLDAVKIGPVSGTGPSIQAEIDGPSVSLFTIRPANR